MTNFLGYPELDKKLKYVEMLFICILIFGTKGYLLAAIVPFIFLYNKRKEISKNKIYQLVKISIFYKLLLILIYSYGNMLNETFRITVVLFLYEYFYLGKRMDILKRKNWILISITLMFTLGLVWNVLSPGGIESFRFYLKDYKILLFLPLFYYLYSDNEKLFLRGKELLPLVILGMFFTFIKLNFNLEKIYILKGNIISVFSLVIPYTFFMILNKKNVWIKLAYIFLFLLGIFLIIKASARGALFSVIIAISLGVILKYRLKGILFAFIGGLVLFSLIKTNPKLKNHFMEVKDFSTRSRYYLMDAGIYTFEKNVVFGSGYKNTQKYFIEYSEKEFKPEKYLKHSWEKDIVKNNYLKNFSDTHNIYIDAIAEYGLLGVAQVILLWILIPITVLISYLKSKNYFYLGIFSALVGYIAAGMSWSIWTKHNMGVLYFIILIYFYLKEKDYLGS